MTLKIDKKSVQHVRFFLWVKLSVYKFNIGVYTGRDIGTILSSVIDFFFFFFCKSGHIEPPGTTPPFSDDMK